MCEGRCRRDNLADVDKDYVMDVRLKKDYMTGFMINAEAGVSLYEASTFPDASHV